MRCGALLVDPITTVDAELLLTRTSTVTRIERIVRRVGEAKRTNNTSSPMPPATTFWKVPRTAQNRFLNQQQPPNTQKDTLLQYYQQYYYYVVVQQQPCGSYTRPIYLVATTTITSSSISRVFYSTTSSQQLLLVVLVLVLVKASKRYYQLLLVLGESVSKNIIYNYIILYIYNNIVNYVNGTEIL